MLRLAAGPAYYRELRRLVNGAGGGFVRALRRLECEGLVGWKYVVRRAPRRRCSVYAVVIYLPHGFALKKRVEVHGFTSYREAERWGSRVLAALRRRGVSVEKLLGGEIRARIVG